MIVFCFNIYYNLIHKKNKLKRSLYMKNYTKFALKLAFCLLFTGLCFAPVIPVLNHDAGMAKAESEDPTQFKTVRASHILVDSEDDAWAIKSRITEGEDFEKLAKEYSKCPSKDKGGDLGFFNRGQMVPEFEYAAFSTPVGEVSDPVKTRFGWHLIKVTRKMRLR